MKGEEVSGAVSEGYIKELKRQKERKEELKDRLVADGVPFFKEAILEDCFNL